MRYPLNLICGLLFTTQTVMCNQMENHSAVINHAQN